ncbi:hypothetical protein SCHPADRAFT_93155 [Schizopora paradoxa]|uniref:Uncharacterized protein n=1 Tax=Schizopora paradoxa TaxID=27342 RepID=A0A0H2S4S5_9AGAM|nr:hypothetical protein SCHPADRAFT_93155 [Schizopora paradoxa]
MLSLVVNERLYLALVIFFFLLVILLVYAYEASVSLKVWLTVQELPPPSRIESTGRDGLDISKELDLRIGAHAGRDKVVLLFLLSIPLFAVLELAMDEPRSNIDRRSIFLFAFPLIYASAKMMDTLAARDLQLGELFAVRTSSGVPILTFARSNKQLGFRFPIPALLYGVFVAFYALYTQGMLSSYLSLHFTLFFLVVNGYQCNTILRFRGRVKYAVLFAIVAMFNFGRAFLRIESSNDSPSSGSEEQCEMALEVLLLSCFFSYLPFELVALCYRFDYSCSKARGEISTKDIGIELCNAKKTDIQTLFDIQLPQRSEEYYGLQLPSLRSSAILATADPKFPKSYYHTACSSFVLSALLVFFLSSETVGLKFTGLATFDAIGLYLMPVALPLMYIVVLLRAAGRGELGLLWNYEERWQLRSHQTNINGSAPLQDGNVLAFSILSDKDSKDEQNEERYEGRGSDKSNSIVPV